MHTHIDTCTHTAREQRQGGREGGRKERVMMREERERANKRLKKSTHKGAVSLSWS